MNKLLIIIINWMVLSILIVSIAALRSTNKLHSFCDSVVINNEMVSYNVLLRLSLQYLQEVVG